MADMTLDEFKNVARKCQYRCESYRVLLYKLIDEYDNLSKNVKERAQQLVITISREVEVEGER